MWNFSACNITTCLNFGECDDSKLGGFECDCTSGWTGAFCEISVFDGHADAYLGLRITSCALLSILLCACIYLIWEQYSMGRRFRVSNSKSKSLSNVSLLGYSLLMGGLASYIGVRAVNPWGFAYPITLGVNILDDILTQLVFAFMAAAWAVVLALFVTVSEPVKVLSKMRGSSGEVWSPKAKVMVGLILGLNFSLAIGLGAASTYWSTAKLVYNVCIGVSALFLVVTLIVTSTIVIRRLGSDASAANSNNSKRMSNLAKHVLGASLGALLSLLTIAVLIFINPKQFVPFLILRWVLPEYLCYYYLTISCMLLLRRDGNSAQKRRSTRSTENSLQSVSESVVEL